MGITITNRAVAKIKHLTNGDSQKGLRISINGGGCSGLSYDMRIDEAFQDDKIFERDNAKIIVDRKSFLYLNGAQLDYADTLAHAGFKLENPNAKRACGCGESFSV